jgi:hypothetical protein
VNELPPRYELMLFEGDEWKPIDSDKDLLVLCEIASGFCPRIDEIRLQIWFEGERIV